MTPSREPTTDISSALAILFGTAFILVLVFAVVLGVGLPATPTAIMAAVAGSVILLAMIGAFDARRRPPEAVPVAWRSEDEERVTAYRRRLAAKFPPMRWRLRAGEAEAHPNLASTSSRRYL